ncbi:hypothetical protein QAD02_002381 [Eretmocerus hayati]|uniref:Uncharacterized protein n=1 Tax=Eretmocerus hayati TaxID=131215 RepID=A0ACC2NJ42_9HYME|nr:hypothetical protein QAD02_002381 [Eretmocerus hayati]
MENQGQAGNFDEEGDFDEAEDLAEYIAMMFFEEFDDDERANMQDEGLADFVDRIFEDFEEIERRRRQVMRLKVLREFLRLISDPFDMHPIQFRKLYRLTPTLARDVVEMLREELNRNRTTRVTEELQVLITLRFLATGSFQRGTGQDFLHPVCQSLVSKILAKVLDAICTFGEQFIFLPRTPEERFQTQYAFRNLIRIPGILGLIDGFLVKMKRPAEHEEAYVNYAHGCSVNVQVIVNAEGRIMSLRIIPGSNNDQGNYTNSRARQYFEALRAILEVVEREGYFYILGDAGYRESRVLLTPIENAPEGSPEWVYTREHSTTRSKVERTIGALSGVWFAANKARVLYYAPEKVATIITAAAILHNIRIMNGLGNDNERPAAQPVLDDLVVGEIDANHLEGLAERELLLDLLYR